MTEKVGYSMLLWVAADEALTWTKWDEIKICKWERDKLCATFYLKLSSTQRRNDIEVN